MNDIEVTREEDEAFEQLARRLDEALQDNARLAAENERQKSEWQAEAVERAANDLYDAIGLSAEVMLWLDDRARRYRRQAEPFTALEDDV